MFLETSLTSLEEKARSIKWSGLKPGTHFDPWLQLIKGEPISGWTDKNYKSILKNIAECAQSDPINRMRWHQDRITAIPEYRDEILIILSSEDRTDNQKVNIANIYIGMYRSDRVGNTNRSDYGLSSHVVRRLVQVYISAVIREMSVTP